MFSVLRDDIVHSTKLGVPCKDFINLLTRLSHKLITITSIDDDGLLLQLQVCVNTTEPYFFKNT